MSSVNIDGIIAKAKKYVETDPDGKVNNVIKKYLTTDSNKIKFGVNEAANKLISEIQMSANGSLSQALSEIASSLEIGDIKYTGDKSATIDINFSQDMSRSSLYNKSKEDLNNIVALYNIGVPYEMNRVYGIWHGKKYASKTVIKGTHFIESAVNSFKLSYGRQYRVIDVTINEEYTVRRGKE